MAGSIRILEALFDEHLERRPAPKAGAEPPAVSGLPLGAPMPDAALLTVQGESVSVESLCDRSAPTALIFVSSGCSACSEVLDGLNGDTPHAGRRPTVILIARGSPAANAPLTSKHPGVPLLFDAASTVADAFRAEWTPAAVLVSPEGTIASDTHFGKAGIEALLAGGTGRADVPSGDARYGERVPEFAAMDSHGQPVGHRALSGTRAALLYWSPTCGYCQAMEDELAQWATDPPARAPRLVLLTGHGAPLPNRFNADVVIADADGAIARRFGLVGTPAAVLTSADGTIASAVGVGADDVKALLGGFARTR
jgi:peroxiredoxin